MKEPIQEPSSIITTADKASDVSQILYALSIRGLRVKAIETNIQKQDRFQIIHDSPAPTDLHVRIAQDSIKSIWDAILEDYPRAITYSGLCHFCQYDVTTLPKPTTCPECGINLDTHKARRAMRDGRKL